MVSGNKSSSYLNYLPSTLQANPELGEFLLAFEHLLSNSGTLLANPIQIRSTPKSPNSPPKPPNPPGLEQVIGLIPLYLDPQQTPEEFLPWLASWVALSLRDDWEPEVKREFVQNMVRLYRIRGTRAGLEELLKLYLRNSQEVVRVYEFDQPAHYFQVELELNSQDLENYRRKEKIAIAIINQEKPAHTYYALRILMPTMRIVSEELALKLAKEELARQQDRPVDAIADSEITSAQRDRQRLLLSNSAPDNRPNRLILGTVNASQSIDRTPSNATLGERSNG
ncbi:hypothetical protein IQ250_02650 [Pseudanabaenaceae cyanobacterium LEGE 13415]|nr:hypothetical protein [Pseudanabaenaceae cyanobacterium LEGE 13415]